MMYPRRAACAARRVFCTLRKGMSLRTGAHTGVAIPRIFRKPEEIATSPPLGGSPQ